VKSWRGGGQLRASIWRPHFLEVKIAVLDPGRDAATLLFPLHVTSALALQ
jgi:hypothetical protein